MPASVRFFLVNAAPTAGVVDGCAWLNTRRRPSLRSRWCVEASVGSGLQAGRSEYDEATYGVARKRVGVALVDLVQRIRSGNHFIEFQLSRLVEP